MLYDINRSYKSICTACLAADRKYIDLIYSLWEIQGKNNPKMCAAGMTVDPLLMPPISCYLPVTPINSGQILPCPVISVDTL